MKWLLPTPIEIPDSLLAWTGHDLLARLLVQRGINTVEAARAFLHADNYEPAPAAALPDMTEAVQYLLEAIAQTTPICVWGDFDVDGQTATALLVSILQTLGAEVRYYVPNRLTEGHGLAIDKITGLLKAGVRLFLTCDTGIEAHAGVQVMQEGGAKVIITDHHDLGQTLPPAEAVINPKRLPANHPLRQLPGVGVAYKLAEALAQAAGKCDAAEPLLDLVALGIVADVALQTGDTRYLLQRGLTCLRQTERPGLLALMSMTNLKQDRLTTEHIGFWLAPRLNALGRLGDANQGVELLITTDKGRARILAAQLDALNERRKLLVDRTVVQALSQLADTPSLTDYNAIVLAASDWHPGIIGIACSRLAQQFTRPVILLTLREGLARGSARSIAGCDIHQAIKTQSHLLESFGGHPMAAGLALLPHHLSEFRQSISEILRDCVAAIEPTLTIDTLVTLPELNLDLLDTLQRLAPFGAGNPRITLAVKELTVEKESIFGRTRAHRRVTVRDGADQTASVIWWQGARETVPTEKFDLALTISRNDYRQQEAVQLVWADAFEYHPETVPIQRQVVDLRQHPHLDFILNDPDCYFWASDPLPQVKQIQTLNNEETTIKKLVIWQAPPGQDILHNLLAALQPEIVYIVARPGHLDTPSTFMKHLMGLIKYALKRYGGRLNLEAIATRMSQREGAIRLGLAWLVSQGKLRVIVKTGQTWVVRADNQPPLASRDDLQTALHELLRETAAYRTFFNTARLATIGLESNTPETDEK